MQEVAIRLKFRTVCLGNAPRQTGSGGRLFAMPRDGDGQILFLPTWWQAAMTYAAKVRSKYMNLVPQIRWAISIDAKPQQQPWKRIVVPASEDPRGRARYALHEAFRPGDTIATTAVLPSGLSRDIFIDLLMVAGTYHGISPFRDTAFTYGLFDVESVLPTATGRAG